MHLWHTLLCRFTGDERGTFAVALALLSVPMLLVVGMASDYSNTVRARAKLQNVTDMAALAATNVAGSYLSAQVLNNSVSQAAALALATPAAEKTFKANAEMAGLYNVTPIITMTPGATNLSITVSYSTTVKSAFSKVLSTMGTPIAGQSTAVYSFPPYIDIHVLLDTSSSMGLGATQTVQEQMRNDGKLNCIFGCHVGGSNAYTYATSKGYRMRIDVLRDSLKNMIQTGIEQAEGQQKPTVRLGLYTFANDYQKVADATYELSDLTDKANVITLANSGGGTDFYNAMKQLNADITRVGNGSSSGSPKTFVFIITDGVEDGAMSYPTAFDKNGKPKSYGWQWDPDNPMPKGGDWGVRPPPKSYCNQFKDRGINVFALYTTYVTFNPITEARESNINKNVIPKIPQALMECSSGIGNFFQADKPEEINTAIQAMFNRATAPLRLAK